MLDIQEMDSSAPQKNSRFIELYEWASSLVTAVVVMITIFAFGARTTQVSGISMLPTLSHGDMLVISRVGMAPAYGDVVVITKPTSAEETLIKRVIATEGQTVDIDFDAGIVYVDGLALDEPYINMPTTRQLDLDFPQTVPKGSVFVMGDNRSYSLDSRSSGVGMIDTRYILGRVLFRFLPTDRFGSVGSPAQ